MTTPISQMPKPEAEPYKDRRKLFLVPAIVFPPDAPEEVQRIQESYWSEVRDHIGNLERSLGQVSHVYHEMVFNDGDDGMKLLQELNPKGSSFIRVMCQSTARLEATEDRALVEESADWQRCVSIGLMSEKVHNIALDGYRDATEKRYQHVASRIDETLKEGESGALFVREDHRIQFLSDIQVFYVAPPSLDALKRWITDQVRATPEPAEPESQPQEHAEPEQSEEPEQTDAADEAEQPE